MTTVAEVQLNKVMGYTVAGYGIVFAYQDSDNYYKLLTTVEGRYMVYKVEGGTSSPILDWDDATHLETGWDKLNTIKIQHDSGTPARTFEIYFNGVLEEDFTVDPYFSDGSIGYYVSVAGASQEYFPYYPVDVRFKLLQPTTAT